jgi:hypothetical protein
MKDICLPWKPGADGYPSPFMHSRKYKKGGFGQQKGYSPPLYVWKLRYIREQLESQKFFMEQYSDCGRPWSIAFPRTDKDGWKGSGTVSRKKEDNDYTWKLGAKNKQLCFRFYGTGGKREDLVDAMEKNPIGRHAQERYFYSLYLDRKARRETKTEKFASDKTLLDKAKDFHIFTTCDDCGPSSYSKSECNAKKPTNDAYLKKAKKKDLLSRMDTFVGVQGYTEVSTLKRATDTKPKTTHKPASPDAAGLAASKKIKKSAETFAAACEDLTKAADRTLREVLQDLRFDLATPKC